MKKTTTKIKQPTTLTGDDYFHAIAEIIKITREKIHKEICKNASDNAKEYDRIVNSMFYLMYKHAVDTKVDPVFNDRFNFSEYKQPTDDLIMLSASYFAIRSSLNELEDNGNLSECLNFIAQANEYFGAYEGHNSHRLIRKLQASKAANIKHQPSNIAKERVTAHYLENKHKYKSKDQASEKIRIELNIPYAFRTVRSWLHNLE